MSMKKKKRFTWKKKKIKVFNNKLNPDYKNVVKKLFSI